MYFKYIKERGNVESLINNEGFFLYKIECETLFILDVFILPEKRRQGKCYEMANIIFKIAKEKECQEVYCEVDLRAKNVEQSTLTILNYGFKMVAAQDSMIGFAKGV